MGYHPPEPGTMSTGEVPDWHDYRHPAQQAIRAAYGKGWDAAMDATQTPAPTHPAWAQTLADNMSTDELLRYGLPVPAEVVAELADDLQDADARLAEVESGMDSAELLEQIDDLRADLNNRDSALDQMDNLVLLAIGHLADLIAGYSRSSATLMQARVIFGAAACGQHSALLRALTEGRTAINNTTGKDNDN